MARLVLPLLVLPFVLPFVAVTGFSSAHADPASPGPPGTTPPGMADPATSRFSSALSVSEDGVVFSPGPVTLFRRAGELVPGITQRSPLRVRNDTSDTLRLTLSGRARTDPGVDHSLLITLTVEGNSTTVPVARLRECTRLVTIDLPARGVATLDVAGSLPWSSQAVTGRWLLEVFASVQSPPYDEAPADCGTSQVLASGPAAAANGPAEPREAWPSVWDASRLGQWTRPFAVTLVALVTLLALLSAVLLRRRVRAGSAARRRPPVEHPTDDDSEPV